MKKKIISVLTVFCLMFMLFELPLNISAAAESSGSCGDNVTWVYDSSAKTLTISGTGAMENYTNSGDAPWYKSNYIIWGIEKIVINDGVTSIGNYAFYEGYCLTNVTIPKSVTRIGERAFYKCNRLPKVTLPGDVTDIGNYAFNKCDAMTELILESTTTIPTLADSALFGLPNNFKVIVPNGRKYAYVEQGGWWYGNRVKIEAKKATSGTCGPTGSEDSVTWRLDGNGTLTISGNGAMKDYGDDHRKADYFMGTPFYPMSEDIINIVVEQGVTSIGSYAFHNCPFLESVTIPDSVTSIGDSAFWSGNSYGNNIKCITIPDSVAEIGEQAFVACDSLEEITFGSGLQSIGFYAFFGCDALKKVNFTGTDTIPALGDDIFYNCGFLTDNDETTGIKLPSCDNLSAYLGTSGWNAYKDYILDKHAPTEEAEKAATCTDDGMKPHWECSVCKRPLSDGAGTTEMPSEDVENVIIPAIGHDWGDWSIQEPTLTETGTAERICANDNTHKEMEELPVLTDTSFWTKTVVSEPTLESTGTYKYTSDTYGDVTVTVPDLSDAAWTKAGFVTEPTSDSEGTYKYTSDTYGDVTVTVPDLSDDSVWTKVDDECIAPTEDDNGKDVYQSDDYGKVTVILPQLNHTHAWGDWELTTDPTNETAGSAKRICTKDSTHTETTTVPALSDTTVWTKVDDECIAPAENAVGKEVYSSEYGKVEVTIPKLEHTHTPSAEWTSDAAGHWHGCSGCTEKLDLAAHTEDGGAVTVQPTKTKKGTKTFTCTVCGYVMRTETIPATGGGSGGSVRPSRPSHTSTHDSGSISEDIQPGTNAPKAEISTPLDALADIVLSPAEKAEVNDGTDIVIILTIEDGSYLVPAADKAKVEAVIGGMRDYKLGQYLDVNLLKIIGGVQEKITETSAPITVMFEIPEALRGEGREYAVIRVHDGETAILSDLDEDADTMTIQTDKFSTYALVYSEKTDSDASDESGEVNETNDTNETNEAISGSGEPASESNEPTVSEEASSEGGEGSSDNNAASPSDEASSTGESGTESDTASSADESDPAAGDITPSEKTDIPATGIAVSVIPLITALSVMTVFGRKKK